MLTAALVVALPEQLLVPVAGVALLVGLGNVVTRPVLGYSVLVCVSVGFATSLRGLDPWATLAEYAVLVLVAVGIGVVVGFTVVPGLRPPPLRARLDRAVGAAAEALAVLAAWQRSDRHDLLEAADRLEHGTTGSDPGGPRRPLPALVDQIHREWGALVAQLADRA